MSLNIYIPTRGRYNMIRRGTLSKFPLSIMKNVFLVVHISELDQYRAAVPMEWRRDGLKIVPLEYTTLVDKKLLIGQHAKSEGCEKICIIDDDLVLLIRKIATDWRLRNQEHQDVIGMFQYIESLLDTYVHGALSPREGNNTIGIGTRSELLKENTRAMRFHFFKTTEFLEQVEHCRLIDVEDFDTTLQLLRKGYKNVVPYWYASGQAKTNSPGGCSLYRDNTVHDREVRKLAELHKGFVALRQKSNKTDADGFGSRTEVTIQWQRAYRSSQNG